MKLIRRKPSRKSGNSKPTPTQSTWNTTPRWLWRSSLTSGTPPLPNSIFFLFFYYNIAALRLSYAKHLSELIEIIDDEANGKIGQILEEFVKYPIFFIVIRYIL